MRYLQGFDKFYLLLIFPVLRLTMPFLQYRFRSWTLIPFVVIWFVHVFQDRRQVVSDSAMNRHYLATCFWLALYMLLPFFFGLLGSDPELVRFRPLGEGTNIIIFVFMLSVAHYSLRWGKIRELKFLVLLLLFSFLWTGIASMAGGEKVIEMGGARMATSLTQERADMLTAEYVRDASEAALSGMGTAASVYVSAFVIPLFLYSAFFVKTLVQKAVCVVMAYASFLSIQYGGINTPYLIASVGCVLMLPGLFFRSRKALVALGAIAAVVMLVFAYHPTMLSFLSDPLQELSYATEHFPQFSSRCASLAASCAGDTDTYAFDRYQLQVKSFDSFLNGNWLFATAFGAKAKVGGHSELLDGLAKYGIISLVLTILFWYSYLQYCRRLTHLCFGPRWSVMPYLFAGTWLFSSIPNPSLLGQPAVMLLLAGLGLYYKEFEERWGVI